MADELKRRDATYMPLSEKYFDEAEVFPSDEEYLLRSLRGLESEMAPTPSFPLYGSEDAKQVIQRFLDTYVLSNPIYPTWMKEYELSRLAKVGPQGGHKSWKELKPLFDLYQERYAQEINVPDDTLDYMISRYSVLSCKALSDEESLRTLKSDNRIETRAAGCRRFALKKTDYEAQMYALRDLHSGLVEKFFGYVFSRYNKLKLRLFMPMPFSDMIREAKWYSPFLRAIQNDLAELGAASPFSFWADKLGFEKCFKIMEDEVNVVDTDRPDYVLLYVQRDFEKMDTTTGPEQQALFTRVLASAFGYHPHSKSYRDLADAMLFPVMCPIATPSGMMIGAHGMASGATSTNGSETVNNEAFDRTAVSLIWKAAEKKKVHCRLLSTKGNGDDGASVWYVRCDELDVFKQILAECYAEAAKLHGFISQADKWHLSTEYGLYCQNFFWMEEKVLHWAYPAVLILNSIMNPEHHYKPSEWDRDYRDLDIIQKLDNGRGLPYFEQLVHFVDNGMKYRLLGDKTNETTQRIFSKFEKYRALQPLAERYNREDWGIATSPTIKLLLGSDK